MPEFNKEITDKFFNQYKILEKIKETENEKYEYFYYRYKSLFEIFRTVRNNLAHNQVDGDYAVYVSSAVLDKLNQMIEKMTENVANKMTPLSKLQVAYLNTSIKEIVEIYQNYNYSVVPVLNKEKQVIAVINEKSILSICSNLLKEHKEINNLLVKDFLKEFDTNNNSKQYFLFKPRNELLYKTRLIFSEMRQDNKRCGAIFITENGKNNEKLLGILTHFDAFKE